MAVCCCQDKYDSLTSLRDIGREMAWRWAESYSSGEVCHENTALEYELISGRDWQNEAKTELGRLPGILGERVADSPALPYPFRLLAVALLLCTLLCKAIDTRGIYEQIVAVGRVILHTKRPINKPMSAKSHANIRSHHVYTIFVHAANYLCYSWVYVVFGAGGEATSLPVFRLQEAWCSAAIP